MHSLLSAAIQSLAPFSDEQISCITDRMKSISLKKNEYIIREGQICQSFYFVNTGSLRHYHIEENGQDATLNLFVQKDWILEYKSFMTQQPSENFIQATTDTELFSLSIWDFHELARASESFLRMGKILELVIRNQDFQQGRLSPEQKYALLIETKPALLQHFPLKHIASFMGMAPETLSRIRKKIIS
jgi:CRP-like cAMP-binding protein